MSENTETLQTPLRPVVLRTHRAAVLTAPGELEIRRALLPEPAEKEVLVKLEGCGVCASNFAAFEGGDWFEYPFAPGIPGHEGWGRIAALGSEVEGFKIGQRVAMLSQHAFAEYDVASADEIAVLPDVLDGVPFPGEALASAVNIFDRCSINPGETVAIIGVGFMGGLLSALATRAGARVIAIARRAAALDFATKMGAAEVIQLGDRNFLLDEIHRLTCEEGCECVIEATGAQEPLNLAAELTRIRGRLVIAGYHQDTRSVNMQLWNWRGLDVINAHERENHIIMNGMRWAVDLVASGKLDPSPLYTHVVSLDELPAMLRTMKDPPYDFMKALVTIN